MSTIREKADEIYSSGNAPDLEMQVDAFLNGYEYCQKEYEEKINKLIIKNNDMSYAIDHKRIQSIHISATSDPENMKNAISQLLYVRKEVAIVMLKCTSDIQNKVLVETYNRINSDICNILGIAFSTEQ